MMQYSVSGSRRLQELNINKQTDKQGHKHRHTLTLVQTLTYVTLKQKY